jgi:hypothetical protein
MSNHKSLFGAILAAIAAAALLLLGPLPEAQGQGVDRRQYGGGSARGTVIRTNTTPYTRFPSAYWSPIPGATVSWTVPSKNIDLFDVTFSATCALENASGGDYLLVLITDNSIGMNPSNGDQFLCLSTTPVTTQGNWLKVAGGGGHKIEVNLKLVDVPPLGVRAVIDDYTLGLTVYANGSERAVN